VGNLLARAFHRDGHEVVVPGRLLQQGFTFQFPYWADAARELCARKRS
jgi:NAD dependent epimerase/dehydratase family enzyme